MPQTVSSDPPDTHILKTEVSGGGSMYLDFSSKPEGPAFHLEAAKHLSLGEPTSV